MELRRLYAGGLPVAEIAARLDLDIKRVENRIHAKNFVRPRPTKATKAQKATLAAQANEYELAQTVLKDFEKLGREQGISRPGAARERGGTSRGPKGLDTGRPAPVRFTAEISALDLHVGKYAWDEETGANYDIRIAEQAFTIAVDDLISRVLAVGTVERFIFPIGNDLLQTDNETSTTTAGTYVDTDSRYVNSFRRACALMRWAVDRMACHAPVTALVVPGNHDRLTAFHVGDVLEAYYRSNATVTIDNRPRPRKYVQIGTTLLGFTHGNEEKEKDLPLIMATEEPLKWSTTTHREWHTGHLHKSRETRWSAGDSFGGVRVRVLPALCSADAWHSLKGYVGELRAAEAYMWHDTKGYLGHFAHTFRESA